LVLVLISVLVLVAQDICWCSRTRRIEITKLKIKIKIKLSGRSLPCTVSLPLQHKAPDARIAECDRMLVGSQRHTPHHRLEAETETLLRRELRRQRDQLPE
jgi:hypothetical protein